MSGLGGEVGEVEVWAQRSGGTRDGRTPQGLTGNWDQAEGGKGGGSQSRKKQKTQARGAGNRDEWQRLVGAGGVQVGSASPWEKRWGAGADDRGL